MTGWKATASVVACLAALLALAPIQCAVAGGTSPAGDAAHDREKSAFETAKELGTADAWDAFLSSYPSGFYADMARAYLKKAGDAQEALPAETPQIVPSSARAAEYPCSERSERRSEHDREPTKITFVNKSGMYRAIAWIDYEGKQKDFGGLNDGEKKVLNTFRTHPWMVMTGPGDCLQIFLPAAEPSVVELLRLPADDGKKAPDEERPAPPQKEAPAKKAEQKKKPLVCAQNYKLQNGRCVLIQNCGKNAYRSPEGDCYCNKGYNMQNGKCVWPQDKNGFEIAPEKKPGCKTWQAQCNRGNGKSCVKYEENCQVN